MREKTTNGQVIIVYTEHPVFGILLIPYIAERLEDGTLQLIEQAFHASPEAIEQMNEAERQAIDIASHYTEKYLMGAYSREKIVSRFLHKLSQDPEKVKNNIRPFIEGKLLEMLTLIRENGLSFYQKQPGSKVLYAHHAYHVHPHDAEVRFTFHVDSSTFRYQLQCYYEKQPFSLDDQKPVIALTASPATLLLGMNLYFFPHIDSVRLLPFTKKKAISASAAQLEKYIDNIVIPIARYHEIITEGWDIPEERCACEALLSLEDITHSEQLLQLGFRYRDQLFTSDNGAAMKKIIYRKDSGEVSFFRRDIVAEKKAIQLLESSGLQRIGDIHFRLSASSSEKTLVEWINKHREMLQSDFQLTGHMGNTPYCLDEIHIEQSCDDEVVDWFELHITVVVGNLRIPFSRFRKHILEEKREYLLPDGRMILLPEEWFSKYANLLEMGVQTEQGIRLKHTFIGAAQAALGGTGLKKFSGKNQIKNVSVPKALKATLRPYQQKGFSWMMHLHKLGFGGCLADDMGLGKTLQTLTLLQHIYKSPASRKAATLIVVPTSLLHNWRREAKRFTTLSMIEYNSSIVVPPNHPGKFFGRFQLIFTTYGMMRNNIDLLSSYKFEYIVLDESQNIKNSESLTFRSALQLESKYRLVLTGTPIEQNTLYEQEKNSLRNILLQHPQNMDKLHSFSILNGILRLRQLACHPQLIYPDFNGASGKAIQIIEIFDTLRSEGHKVLIFSSFVKHLEVLAEAFRERGWKYALLTGATNNRPSEIAHFTEQKDVQAFLISLKAGGVGLNLTQADYVFIIDPWWNPAAESQAIARAHRIGQDKQVIAYRFITQNSIEEKILYLQDEKRKLAETFVTDSETLPALSNEQWVDLLK